MVLTPFQAPTFGYFPSRSGANNNNNGTHPSGTLSRYNAGTKNKGVAINKTKACPQPQWYSPHMGGAHAPLSTTEKTSGVGTIKTWVAPIRLYEANNLAL